MHSCATGASLGVAEWIYEVVISYVLGVEAVAVIAAVVPFDSPINL